MLKRSDNFWIRFAGLYCRVTATPGIKAIIHKYFSGSYISVSDRSPKSSVDKGYLVIRQRAAKHEKSSVVISNNGLRFVMEINGSPHLYYPLLAQVLQRIFMLLFDTSGGIVFHASAVESHGQAHVFVGDSGKGKTTVARLSNNLYGLRVLADNQVFIRKRGGNYLVYPFPFTQFHKDGNKDRFPIAAFYILHKSSSFAVRSLSFMESLRALTHEIQILSASDTLSGARISPLLRHAIFDFAKTVIIKRLYFFRGKGIWEAINGSS